MILFIIITVLEFLVLFLLFFPGLPYIYDFIVSKFNKKDSEENEP